MRIETVLFFILTLAVGVPKSASAGSASWNDWSVIWQFHTDVSLGYNAAADSWSLGIDRGSFGETGSTVLDPAHTILLATLETIRTLPQSIPSSFSFLGESGDTYYLFPFSEPSPGNQILYLGSNGYRLPSNVFTGGTVNWSLASFDGPGDFFLYRVIGSNPVIYMDSRPSEPPYGPGFEAYVGGHSHFNWVFREPGIYLLSFQVEGELLSGGTAMSDEIPFFFLVDPKPFEWWLVDQFREEVKGPEASLAFDASGDGYTNLLAYALGYSPFEQAASFLPRHEMVERNGETYLSLLFRQPESIPERDDRSDLVYRIQSSYNLTEWNDISDATAWEVAEPDEDGTRRIRVVDTAPLESASRRFLRLVVEHHP